MKSAAALSAAALIAAGLFTTSPVEARGGGALAAGLVGGLAAGALLGAALSEAQAAPGYGDRGSDGYGSPYGYGRAPVVSYRRSGFDRPYGYETPIHAGRRWNDDGDGYGYAPVARRWQPHCYRPYGDRPYGDRLYGDRGW